MRGSPASQISMVVGSAGLPFAVAIAVEMLFLGLTFATAVLPHPRHRAAAAAVAGPACILAGAVCGGLAARAFTSAPAAMVGCTAFGSYDPATAPSASRRQHAPDGAPLAVLERAGPPARRSALLYMVAEELLLAAHEEGRDHVRAPNILSSPNTRPGRTRRHGPSAARTRIRAAPLLHRLSWQSAEPTCKVAVKDSWRGRTAAAWE